MEVSSLYYFKGTSAAALAHNVQLLCEPSCCLEVTPAAVLHIHQQLDVTLSPLPTTHQELFLHRSKLTCRRGDENKQGGWAATAILHEL